MIFAERAHTLVLSHHAQVPNVITSLCVAFIICRWVNQAHFLKTFSYKTKQVKLFLIATGKKFNNKSFIIVEI